MNKSNFCETRNKTCHCFQYVFHSTLGFVGAEIFINFCFLSIILATDMLDGQSKALKTRILVYFKKKLEPREWVNGFGSWPGKGGQINAKTPPLVTFPQRTPNRKRKTFFSMSTRRLAESVEGLNSSLPLAAADLWPKKCRPIHWPARPVKG